MNSEEMEKINREWDQFEKFEGQKLPAFLKVMLWKCGYDSMISLKELSSVTISELEKYIQNNRNKMFTYLLTDLSIDLFESDSIKEYQGQAMFEFLPGHRHILLCLRNKIENMQQQVSTAKIAEYVETSVEYSVILSELLETARMNAKKSKHANQYSDIIRYFSTYIFLLCGRTCYETLNKNLPIPSTKTICK